MDSRPTGETRFRPALPPRSSEHSLAPGAARPEIGKGIRSSRILPGVFYSLRDASLLSGLPESRIRRAILLEDLPAQEVPDDRHYLIQGRSLAAYVGTPVGPAQPSGPAGAEKESVHDQSSAAVLFVLAMVFVFMITLLSLAYSSRSRTAEPDRSRQASQEILTPPASGPTPAGRPVSPGW